MKFVESVLGPNWIRVRMQRPPSNGLTPEFCRQLSQVLGAASANPVIRAIMLESGGGSFCLGADLKWASESGIAGLCGLVRAMQQVCEILYTCRKPVLTAIAGTASGGGVSLALAGDVRIASLKASFRLAYPTLGVSMDGGSSFRFPQLIGHSKTQEFLYGDRVFTATEARALGLIHEAVHPDKFEERVCQRLEQLASGPTAAWAESKALLNPPEWVRERLEREAEAVERVVQGQDARRGMAAFSDKRVPQFTGS